MKINIFEGGRRIHGVLSWGALLVAIVVAFTQESLTTVVYSVLWLDSKPIRTSVECGFNDRDEYQYLTTHSGKSFRANLCFRASKTSTGKLLIPYKAAEEGRAYMESRWSSEVEEYAKKVSSSFEVPEKDMKEIDSLVFWDRVTSFFTTIGWTMLGIFIFWIVSFLAGWILRGFLGIPTGQDTRPPAA